jgi:hypothetical protein
MIAAIVIHSIITKTKNTTGSEKQEGSRLFECLANLSVGPGVISQNAVASLGVTALVPEAHDSAFGRVLTQR